MTDPRQQHRSRRRLSIAAFVAFVVAGTFFSGVYVGRHYRHTDPEVAESGAHTDVLANEVAAAAYSIDTHMHSYFKRDEAGGLELEGNSPFRGEGPYTLRRQIEPNRTAIVVMDAWVDMASDHLNAYYGEITATRIVPLIERAIPRGHPVILLTNDPELVTYNTRIHADLEALVERGDAVMLYHQDLDDRAFADYLQSEGIDALVYVGFASNVCVVGRKMGMIPMKHLGFTTYFVPDASAAVELPDTWDNGLVHSTMTRVISQWIAELIDFDDLMGALELEPSRDGTRQAAGRDR